MAEEIEEKSNSGNAHVDLKKEHRNGFGELKRGIKESRAYNNVVRPRIVTVTGLGIMAIGLATGNTVVLQAGGLTTIAGVNGGA